jgi:hypothetical protein
MNPHEVRQFESYAQWIKHLALLLTVHKSDALALSFLIFTLTKQYLSAKLHLHLSLLTEMLYSKISL